MLFESYFEVVDTNGLLRYSTVFEDEAVRFSQDLYRRTKMFSEVYEVKR